MGVRGVHGRRPFAGRARLPALLCLPQAAGGERLSVLVRRAGAGGRRLVAAAGRPAGKLPLLSADEVPTTSRKEGSSGNDANSMEQKTFIDLIGNTPLVHLRRASEETGCTILGKAEFLNPGQSVKDRAALWIVRDAERRGLLRPGGTIVEGTAGNTGIGLALVSNALGYRSVIVMPETQSQEKKDMLQLCGAELILVPAVPYKDPMNYVRYSGRLAEELAAKEPNGAIWANQFDNTANRQAHLEGTGPEIWRQTEGKVDARSR